MPAAIAPNYQAAVRYGRPQRQMEGPDLHEITITFEGRGLDPIPRVEITPHEMFAAGNAHAAVEKYWPVAEGIARYLKQHGVLSVTLVSVAPEAIVDSETRKLLEEPEENNDARGRDRDPLRRW